MKKFDIELGRILRAEREAHGVTQQEMAKALGCTNVAVSNWETGKRSMYAITLRRYCEYLGITMQSVFDQMGE